MGTHKVRSLLALLVTAALLVAQGALVAPASACVPEDVLGYSTSADWRVGGAAFGRGALEGSVLYTPSPGGMSVWDVSKETTATLLADLDLGAPAAEISVEGTRACAVGAFGGMKVLDVSDPAAPSVVATFLPAATGLAVAIHGDDAYVSFDGVGLKAVDISDPAAPAALGVLTPESGFDTFGEIRFRDEVAYVMEKSSSGGGDAVAAIDIEDPSAMSILGSWTSSSALTAFGVCTSSGAPSVLAAESGHGWMYVDFSDPAAPYAPGEARSDAGTEITDLVMADDRVLITDASSGLTVWSLDEGSPYDLLASPGVGRAPVNGMAVDGDLVSFGEPSGFTVYTGVTGTKPLPIAERCSFRAIPAEPVDAAAVGHYLYCFDEARGLVVADLAGDTPKVVFAETGGEALGASLDATGSRVAVGAGKVLRAFSTTDPASPALLGSAYTAGDVADVTLVGERAYVAERDGKLEVFDVSGAPALIGSWDGAAAPAGTVETLRSVWVGDGHAYVAGGPSPKLYAPVGPRPATAEAGGQVVVLDLAAADPVEVTRFDTIGAALSVTGHDGRLYVGTDQKLQIADIANPADAHILGTYLYFGYGLRDLGIDDEGRVVWAATPQGLFAIDVSDPDMPYALGNFGGTGLKAYSVAVSDGLAVVAEPNRGVAGVRLLAERRSGTSRYGTSAELSRGYFDQADTVVLATGATYADAVCGAPLARMAKGPMLLTGRDKLPPEVRAELVRLGAKSAYVLGGQGAVSDAVEDELEGMGLTVTRIAGTDRYDTSRLVALEVMKLRGVTCFTQAFIASGVDFPDALSASGPAARLGVPVLLTAPKSVPAATRAALVAIQSPSTIVVGGTGAVSDAVYSSVKGAVRLGGTSRFDTAARVGAWALANVPGFGAEKVIATTGMGFADALAAGVVAAEKGAPVVLTTTVLPVPTRAYLAAHQGQVHNALIVGGTGAVSPDVTVDIARYLR